MYPGKKVEYSIPTKGPFEINKESGMITVAGKLDYEQERSYTFVVSARDVNDSTISTCTDVTVHVLDVNDNAPVFAKYQEQYKVNTVIYISITYSVFQNVNFEHSSTLSEENHIMPDIFYTFLYLRVSLFNK